MKPGHCGCCGKQLEIKVIVDRLSTEATTRPFCVDEDDDRHRAARSLGWDPYDPEGERR